MRYVMLGLMNSVPDQRPTTLPKAPVDNRTFAQQVSDLLAEEGIFRIDLRPNLHSI